MDVRKNHPTSLDTSPFRGGTLDASARVIDRIRGTGSHWENWSDCRHESSTDSVDVSPPSPFLLSDLSEIIFRFVGKQGSRSEEVVIAVLCRCTSRTSVAAAAGRE
jgi:hypothetical protein